MIFNRSTLNKAACKWEGGLAGLGKLLSLQRNPGGDSVAPIFVIGTGRCGSTLFSRVLESHDNLVTYPTEANNLFYPRSYPYKTATIDTPPILQDPGLFTELSVKSWPRGHEEKIRNTFTGFQFLNRRDNLLFIKSAMISFLVPRLIQIFPDAKFIHLYRNGPSVVASIMKKEWHKYAEYTTEQSFLVWAARYWSQCILEIDRADKANDLAEKGRLFELSYEEFCEDPGALSARLATFLQCNPGGFRFDFSTIQSTNYKAQALGEDQLDLIDDFIKPGMMLKQYLLPH